MILWVSQAVPLLVEFAYTVIFSQKESWAARFKMAYPHAWQWAGCGLGCCGLLPVASSRKLVWCLHVALSSERVMTEAGRPLTVMDVSPAVL